MTETTVYATDTGRAYHAHQTCPALANAQAMNDYHRVFWTERNRYHRLHDINATTPQQATADGKHRCPTCKPPMGDPIAASEAFGHEPVDEYAGEGLPVGRIVCARCMHWIHWREAGLQLGARVSWPCASARVLGLSATPAVSR